MATFTKDVNEIRRRAMHKIEDGAVTDGYKLDKERAIVILNEALATEIVCVLRYQHHYFMATGVHGRGVADLFKEHADEERGHADGIAERIQQLGGKPNFNPGDLVARSVSQYIEGESLSDMIREDLIAERMVIDVYQRMIEYFGLKDPTTRIMLEHIKGEEEEHASELSDMMFIVDPRTGEDEGEDPGTDPLHLSRRDRTGATRQSGRNQESAESDSDEMEEEELTSVAEDHEEERVATTRGSARKSSRSQGRSSNERKSTTATRRPKEERVMPKAPRGASLATNRSPRLLTKTRKGKKAA